MATASDDGGGKTGRKKVKDDKAKTPRILTQSNLTKLKGELSDYIEAMDKKFNDREEVLGEFSMDIKGIKERFANKTGHSQSLLTKLYTQHRNALKMEQWRKEAEKDEVDSFDELMAASEGIKDTPLFRVARERMAAPANDTAKP